jgi:hypothetical protein
MSTTSYDGRISHVVNRQDDVIMADAIALYDGHGHVVGRLGAMPI